MDPSLAAIRRQGNEASEFTTDVRGERLRNDWNVGDSPRGTLGQAVAQHAAPLKGNWESKAEWESGRRILGGGRRICIVLEMRHLLGTLVEKAARLLLE